MLMPLTLTADSNPKTELEGGVKKVNKILDENMEYLVNEHVIPELRAVGFASNVPPDFVIHIAFKKTGENRGEIINTWGNEKLPLALWFNYGTKDHGSLGWWPLHWKDKTTGKDIYAMWVRGVPKTLVMETGIDLGLKKLRAAVPKFIEAKLK